tara:strand:- start:274 stop:444 length:171 start_codon:yes stop_codon:yes gene_type:complete
MFDLEYFKKLKQDEKYKQNAFKIAIPGLINQVKKSDKSNLIKEFFKKYKYEIHIEN